MNYDTEPIRFIGNKGTEILQLKMLWEEWLKAKEIMSPVMNLRFGQYAVNKLYNHIKHLDTADAFYETNPTKAYVLLNKMLYPFALATFSREYDEAFPVIPLIDQKLADDQEKSVRRMIDENPA